MKIDKLVGERFKEKPSDCVVDSHALFVRGGYMKYVANGIYSQYMPLRRITKKIEDIIREEMDKIDGQEVLFPVVMPASLWEESGRFTSVGSELIRLKDRSGIPMILGMTHEEAAVQMAREYANSYTKYPFMIYQIQTKVRDEARPRAGLIRTREFTMKDAYSFHTSQEDLEHYYAICYEAYHTIFARAGLSDVITVASDSGMMGGNLSHEYMFITPIGEDSIAICSECEYRANMEAAECIVEVNENESMEKLEIVHTPNMHAIEDVCNFLESAALNSCKAVVYQKDSTNEYIIIFIRGDLEINETKLTNYLGEDVYPANITEESGIQAGFIGPKDFKANVLCTILYDRSLKDATNLVCGANRVDYHYTGLNMSRDCGAVEYHDFAKIIDGGICPKCGKHSIKISRGIEVGNIFQLGTKYTKSMNMQYQDQNGESQFPIMGCYGIGIGRLAASVCEKYHDDFGPIWPMSIAPWQVHICCLRADDINAKNLADDIYKKLTDKHIEVIYDDRKVRPGVMFSDADLLGVPVRVIVSPRNLEESCVEVVTRDKTVQIKVTLEDAVSEIERLVEELKAKCN